MGQKQSGSQVLSNLEINTYAYQQWIFPNNCKNKKLSFPVLPPDGRKRIVRFQADRRRHGRVRLVILRFPVVF